MPCMATPRLLELSRQPERTSRRHLRCQMHGHDGGATAALAPRQQPRGSVALEDADTEDRVEAVAAAEDRRLAQAAHLALGALEGLHHHLLAKAELEPW